MRAATRGHRGAGTEERGHCWWCSSVARRASVLRVRPECGPVGWGMVRSRPHGYLVPGFCRPSVRGKLPRALAPITVRTDYDTGSFPGQRMEAGCEVLRPVGDSVAWVRSPRQPLHVGLSTDILGCSSLGCGKAEGLRH